MKLDSTIIGAIIIGAFVYQYNSDYQVCVRELDKMFSTENALRLCKNINR